MPSIDDVITKAKRSIASAIATDRVREFYIGRSVNAAARNSEHRAHEIRRLHQTASVNHALEIENALISHFLHHPKNSNEQNHAGGNTAEGVQQIYLALWFA